MPTRSAATAEQALELLREGNARFVAGERHTELFGPSPELVAGQRPWAVVLGCSDSRVPVEIVFDQAPGNLFVVRDAGNVLDENGLASIEYSVSVLGSKLVLVLGHTRCGAVEATLQYLRDGKPQPGHIQRLVDAIVPAALATREHAGDPWENAIAENVRHNTAALTQRSRIIFEAVASGSAAVAGAVYDLRGGKVTFLETE